MIKNFFKYSKFRKQRLRRMRGTDRTIVCEIYGCLSWGQYENIDELQNATRAHLALRICLFTFSNLFDSRNVCLVRAVRDNNTNVFSKYYVCDATTISILLFLFLSWSQSKWAKRELLHKMSQTLDTLGEHAEHIRLRNIHDYAFTAESFNSLTKAYT